MRDLRATLARLALAAPVVIWLACSRAASDEARLQLGHPATSAEIANADIDVAPDGSGLPPGSGTARLGETVFVQRCAACHASGGFALSGGVGTLSSAHPVRTVTSYWPYATSVFDYIRRAMPPDRIQPISAADDYAVTAYILALDAIIAPNDVMDSQTLPRVRMPNLNGFVTSESAR